MANHNKMRNAEYYELQNCFDDLFAKSKKGCVFTRLMDIIASESNIRLAYRNVKRNKGSYTAGVDKINICDIKKLDIKQYINIFQEKLNWYIPQAVKRIELKKETGGKRPLGIPTISDRLVQQCILQVLDPICDAKFHTRNNGYRTNRALEHAIAQCYDMIINKKMLFVVDVTRPLSSRQWKKQK